MRDDDSPRARRGPGEGSVFCRRDRPQGTKRWVAQIYLGLDPTTGRSRYTSTYHVTQREAVEALRQRHQHRSVADEGSTLPAMIQRWTEFQQIGVPVGLRFDVLKRDGYRCVYCGTSVQLGAVLRVDHVVPRSKGGQTAMENLVAACHECNLGKRAKSP